ncbi:uncharacterized protein [Halyomorpha halys]|uniref:uncharacterized protein isoform X2 n=1 Tax=Halyomorpha halys TaxID=286706 RepID=UPI0006D4D821|nr:uncharacterized protein LOC106683261 isoform X2 [Halyomorpha halys]
MGIRRSLRLQSRSGGINENAKQSVKKNKLPRKRKVKVKSSTKIYSGLTPRRSLRIKKRNSYYSVEGDLSAVDQSTTQIINNVKIEPCEVKLEQIDMLIEKLSIGSNEINDCKESQKPVNCEEVRDTMEVPMESEQYENNCTDEQSNENCKSSVETDITCPNEEANPTEIDIKEIEDETLKEQKERFGEREETAKKITEV